MKLLGIFGSPVSHSRSPLIHNAAIADQSLLPAVYTRKLVENGKDLRTVFDSCGFFGGNITVPHKEEAFRQADRLDPLAEKIGAVNTWVRVANQVVGYNTDALGFMETIRDYETPQKTLIIGAGGTARAIATIFQQNGLDQVVLNRSANRLRFFADQGIKTASWDNMPFCQFDLVINTTSAGLSDDELPLAKEHLIRYFESAKYAVDIIYGKQTPFLQLADQMNLTTQDGKMMLIYQAVHAFKLFFPEANQSRVETVMKMAFDL